MNAITPLARSAPRRATPAPDTPVLTALQAATARAIVSVFETSQVQGDYGAVAVLAGDSGGLSYGRAQAARASGGLHRLLQAYADAPGARWGARLAPWLPRLQARDAALDADARLHDLLRACADDPVMRDVQDRFFEAAYWAPAVRQARALGIRLPLGVCVVYDGTVHGSWPALRDATGPFTPADERGWLRHHVQRRRAWLAGHRNRLLRSTTWRMDALERLMDLERWDLALPLVVRGQAITAAALAAQPPGCHDGPAPGSRVLAVQAEVLRGLDVRLLQLALGELGHPTPADALYGPGTARSVAAWQRAQGLPPTGVADPDLVARVLAAAGLLPA